MSLDTKFLSEALIIQEVLNFGGYLFGASRFYDKTIFAIFYYFRHGANPCRHNWKFCRHGFDYNPRKAFFNRWQNEYVKCAKQFMCIRNLTQKDNFFLQTFLFY